MYAAQVAAAARLASQATDATTALHSSLSSFVHQPGVDDDDDGPIAHVWDDVAVDPSDRFASEPPTAAQLARMRQQAGPVAALFAAPPGALAPAASGKRKKTGGATSATHGRAQSQGGAAVAGKPKDPNKIVRPRAAYACVRCQESHTQCSNGRPCGNCVLNGFECVTGPHKQRGRRPKKPPGHPEESPYMKRKHKALFAAMAARGLPAITALVQQMQSGLQRSTSAALVGSASPQLVNDPPSPQEEDIEVDGGDGGDNGWGDGGGVDIDNDGGFTLDATANDPRVVRRKLTPHTDDSSPARMGPVGVSTLTMLPPAIDATDRTSGMLAPASSPIVAAWQVPATRLHGSQSVPADGTSFFGQMATGLVTSSHTGWLGDQHHGMTAPTTPLGMVWPTSTASAPIARAISTASPAAISLPSPVQLTRAVSSFGAFGIAAPRSYRPHEFVTQTLMQVQDALAIRAINHSSLPMQMNSRADEWDTMSFWTTATTTTTATATSATTHVSGGSSHNCRQVVHSENARSSTPLQREDAFGFPVPTPIRALDVLADASIDMLSALTNQLQQSLTLKAQRKSTTTTSTPPCPMSFPSA